MLSRTSAKTLSRVSASAVRAMSTGEFFPDIKKIEYEGPESKNPLAFNYYNADEVVAGKTMNEWCRFAVSYWHTMRGGGNDPFGPDATIVRPWDDGSNSLDNALVRTEAP